MAAAGESSGPSRLDPSGRSRAAPMLRAPRPPAACGAGDGRSCAAAQPAGLATVGDAGGEGS